MLQWVKNWLHKQALPAGPQGEASAVAEGSAVPSGEEQGMEDPAPQTRAESWMGVGLDGTLAFCEGEPLEEIGPPVPNMVARVLDWMDQGLQVKILTWRASTPEGQLQIQEWLSRHGLPPIEATSCKTLSMVEFWDCNAVQIIPNSGKPVGPSKLPLPPEE